MTELYFLIFFFIEVTDFLFYFSTFLSVFTSLVGIILFGFSIFTHIFYSMKIASTDIAIIHKVRGNKIKMLNSLRLTIRIRITKLIVIDFFHSRYSFIFCNIHSMYKYASMGIFYYFFSILGTEIKLHFFFLFLFHL